MSGLRVRSLLLFDSLGERRASPLPRSMASVGVTLSPRRLRRAAAACRRRLAAARPDRRGGAAPPRHYLDYIAFGHKRCWRLR